MDKKKIYLTVSVVIAVVLLILLVVYPWVEFRMIEYGLVKPTRIATPISTTTSAVSTRSNEIVLDYHRVEMPKEIIVKKGDKVIVKPTTVKVRWEAIAPKGVDPKPLYMFGDSAVRFALAFQDLYHEYGLNIPIDELTRKWEYYFKLRFNGSKYYNEIKKIYLQWSCDAETFMQLITTGIKTTFYIVDGIIRRANDYNIYVVILEKNGLAIVENFTTPESAWRYIAELSMKKPVIVMPYMVWGVPKRFKEYLWFEELAKKYSDKYYFVTVKVTYITSEGYVLDNFFARLFAGIVGVDDECNDVNIYIFYKGRGIGFFDDYPPSKYNEKMYLGELLDLEKLLKTGKIDEIIAQAENM